ncbi:uncharacterized protein LOC131621821 [Vicia villosa]|uniref:uncharacterized protein LOC131621821 n=1 Tax=Vicia villosa TaxID=3911 RepID=UPI00273AB1FD|nr:uncharacterized protein LOC131621821 [Vicia villosa]
MASAAFASSPQIATFLSKSSSSSFHFQPRFSSLSLPTTPSFSPIITTSRKPILFQTNSKLLPLPVAAATAEDAAVDATEQLVTTTDDGVSVVVSVLFFIAFIGLSVITIGVIYLAVTDFLTKREKEKFEKEEAKSGKKKKKKKVVRAGPKGFGQKIIETEEDD